MRTFTLLARNLRWYWRTNLAALLGVAAATGVLGGALLTGHSIRASLRGLALSRLGNAETVVSREGFFRESLAAPLGGACPLIATEGVVTHEASGRRAARVEVYGVDSRFWAFQELKGEPPRGRQALLTSALAGELGGAAGDTLLLRLSKAPAIPLESLHGRKEDAGKTIRLAAGGVSGLEFSLRLRQGDVRAVYVPLARLQRELERPGEVNTMLAGGMEETERALAGSVSAADLGVRVKPLDERRGLSVESETAVIGDHLARAVLSTARLLGLRAQPVLTYLANTIRAGRREIPYSVVTALDTAPAPGAEDGITLNEWAARVLGARAGDPVELEYYVWRTDGRLTTESARFKVSGVVPIEGEAADRELAPEYPGITGSTTLADWDPPFPMNLARIRDPDERYWKRYRTIPKAYVSLVRGQRLWGTRHGALTSVRVSPPSSRFAPALLEALEPAKMGLQVRPARAEALEASRGATDFGEYFVYFGFFLVVSALLLTGLFFRLGVEQRMREAGVLRALGFSMAKLRRLFLLEGLALAGGGAVAGMAAALGYCAAVVFALRTWWFDAVGTKALSAHASVAPLAMAAGAGVVAGLAVIAWSLRRLAPVTPRGLIAGDRAGGPSRRLWWAGGAAAMAAGLAMAASLSRRVDYAAGFFASGALLLAAALLLQWAWLRSPDRGAARSRIGLGFRNAARRPGRSTLCIALIASAVFLLVSLNAFQGGGSAAGTGGYPLLAESVLPLVHDPNTAAGREALNIPPLEGVEFVPFRLRPGDDTSCLNLYRPRRPRVLAPPPGFFERARFAFAETAAAVENPWRLLEAPDDGGAVPAIADANSLEYVLHGKVGGELLLDGVRYRIVASLRDSLFQGELLIPEASFLRLFPGSEGFRFFLLAAPARAAGEVTASLEQALSDYGFDVQPAAARLAGFHKVEKAYLAAFGSLGSLGLVLGTVGLGAVLSRNVLERRKELALLRAVGYRPGDLAAVVLAENVLLLAAGVGTGAGCALAAVLPAALSRGGGIPAASILAVLVPVVATGIAASLAATAAALRSPLLAALRSE